jgi:hypothetical protein
LTLAPQNAEQVVAFIAGLSDVQRDRLVKLANFLHRLTSNIPRLTSPEGIKTISKSVANNFAIPLESLRSIA